MLLDFVRLPFYLCGVAMSGYALGFAARGAGAKNISADDSWNVGVMIPGSPSFFCGMGWVRCWKGFSDKPIIVLCHILQSLLITNSQYRKQYN